MILSIKYFCKPKLLLWTFMNLIQILCVDVQFKLFMIVRVPERSEVPHTVQNAMYKSLHMKN